MYFQKYRLRKTWLDKCLKSRVSEDPELENMENWSKECSNQNDSTFTKFINHSWRWFHWKKSLFVINKFLRVFLNRLTVYDKHYLVNRDNLTEPIQIQLSQKQKTFIEFFFAFSKSLLNFEHWPTKDDPHNWCILENLGSAKYG